MRPSSLCWSSSYRRTRCHARKARLSASEHRLIRRLRLARAAATQRPARTRGGVCFVTGQSPGTRRDVQHPGQHAHWQLDSSDTPLLRPASLPEVAPGGCGFELVEAQPVAAPVSLTIASARITAAVVELGVSADGQMEAPPTPDVVGWYRMSARPGNRATVYSVATSTGAAIQRCSGGCGVCTRASRLSSPVPTVSVIRMSSTGTSRSRGRRHQSTASSGHRRTAS